MPSFSKKFSEAIQKKKHYGRVGSESPFNSRNQLNEEDLKENDEIHHVSDEEELVSSSTRPVNTNNHRALETQYSPAVDGLGIRMYASRNAEMDIEGARMIDDASTLIVESPNDLGRGFITKESFLHTSISSSRQVHSAYNMKSAGQSSFKQENHKSLSSNQLTKSNSVNNISQSSSITSLAGILPTGYTIKKKQSFRLFPSITLGRSEENDLENSGSVFFDLEKPKKSDEKDKKKLKKKIFVCMYRSSILLISFFLLSIFVFFTVSAVNSADDDGYYTNGSPTTLLWISGLAMLLTLCMIFELVANVAMVNVFRNCLKLRKPSDIFHYDSYFATLVYRCAVFLLFFSLCSINWICYSLFFENRDHLAGWVSLYLMIPLFGFLIISYKQYSTLRSDIVDFEHHEEHLFTGRNVLCCLSGFILKFIAFISFVSIGTIMILFTIQSIALIDDMMPEPGKKWAITLNHHTYKVHMYCEGNEKTSNVVLIDADIGIASPYEYMKKLVSTLALSGLRACVIERAGYGFSDTGPLPRDINNTVIEVVNAVYESRMRVPFLYIAHSAASFTARKLAAEHPELLSGMLLLHPAHEDLEKVMLRQVKNLTDAEILKRKRDRDYIDDTIRYLTPIALPRLFKYFHVEFLLEYEDPYELYYMNGWKNYFFSLLNITEQNSINRRIIFQNKYAGCVWSELNHFLTDSADVVRNMRPSNGTTTIPVVILTAGNLLYGDCVSNHYQEDSLMCVHFHKWREGRQQALLKLHEDLAQLYKAEWYIIETSYDIPIDSPEIVTNYAKRLLRMS
ncbi:hypothetical protein C9374_008593 [Naegleria lovaniensis]|uniref:Uncharacterized protein n=1 Tax=Naegleria lovaniensis TaxID=51637 RepID=A0AA88GIS1_NAELO|nr:uncharacterized protein C9374_008593 [Naegleria lovaniensis]KAG2377971.1 hypothetical protein C9374_008593 [Naegleria lovaniensis]